MLLFMLQFQIACKEYIVEITDNCVYTCSNSTSIQHYLEFDFSAVSYNEGSVVVITMQHITSTSIPFLHKVTNEILLLLLVDIRITWLQVKRTSLNVISQEHYIITKISTLFKNLTSLPRLSLNSLNSLGQQ